MKKRLILFLALSAFIAIESSAQVVGDYRTQADGNWTTLATWQRLNSIGPQVWATPTGGQGYPGQNASPGTVTILNTHDVILDVSPANNIGILTVGGGASGTLTAGVAANSSFSLTCSGAVTISTGASLLSRVDTDGAHTFTFQSTLVNDGTINFAAGTEQITLGVTGTTTNNGSLTFGIDTGVKTFTGTVSNTGTWTSTTVATTANLVFGNGASSSGASFAAGGATFNTTAGQSIGGTAAMSFANGVAINVNTSLVSSGSISFAGIVTVATGVTLTNNNTNTVTMSNTGVALASGGAGSAFTQGTTGNTLSYAGSSIGLTALNASGANNLITYTGASPAIFATTYNNLTVNGSGTATVGGSSTVNGTMTVSSAVTNNSILTVATDLSGASTLTQGAGSTLNIGGTSGITGLDASTNANTVNYTGAAQTVNPVAFRTLGLSGSGAKTMTGITTIGTDFNIGGTASATAAAALTIGGNFTLGTGTTFTAGAFTHNIAGNWVNNGGTFTNAGSTINLNGTTPSIGGSNSTTFNNLTLASSGTATFSIATFTGGNLSISGAAVANLGTITTHTAGTLTLGGANQPSGSHGGTSSGAAHINTTYFAATTGLVTVSTCVAGVWLGTTSTDWNIGTNWCGGSVPNASTDVVILSGGNQPTIGAAGGLCNNITIGSGATLTISGSNSLTVGGNWTNNGAFTGNTSTVTFNGTCTLGGTSATTFYNVSLNASSVITAAAVTISGNLAISNASTFTAADYALTVTGSTTVGGGASGNFIISSATGTKTFTGDVTLNAGAVWNETAAATINYGGSLANNATTFTASTGVHTFSGTTKTLSGTTTTSIPTATFTGTYTNAGTFTSATALTINTPGILTNNGTVTASTALSGTGEVTQGATGILNIGGTSGITTLTATASGNMVNYTGAAQTVHSNNYHHLTLSGSGTAVLQTGTTAIGGNLTLSGTVATTTVAGLAITGNLSIGDGTTLTSAAFALTVTGATTVGGGTSGNFTISSATGAKTFVGLVTVAGGATWTNTAANSPVTFRGGIINSGTFNAGTGVHTFDTNAQTLTGTLSMPNVTVTTITLTNNNTLTVATALVGTGELTQAATGILNIGGTSGITTLTAAAVGNTVNYTGAAQTVHSNNYHHLTLSGSGTVVLQTGTTAIGGNLTLSGTVTTTTVAGLAITGNLTVGNGTTLTSAAFALTVSGATTVGGGTSGNFTISSATGAKTFVGLVAVAAGATWTNTAANSPVTFRGGITNSGTFNAGTGLHTFDTNAQALTGTLVIPSVTVTTITLTNNGTLTVATALGGTGGLTQAATGILNIGGTSGITTLTATAVGNTVNYTGTAQTVIATNYGSLGLSGSGAKSLGAGTTSISGNLTLGGTVTITPVVAMTIGGTVTLGAGTTFTGGAFTHNIAGNWTNNGGTFTNAGTTINLNGAAQSIGGTNSTTFNNLTLSGSGTVTFVNVTTIASVFSISGTAVANLGTGLTHTSNTLVLGGNGEKAGSWGGTASVATNKSVIYFGSTATGTVNVAVGTCAAGLWTGTTSTDWNTGTNWCSGTVPTAATDVIIQSAPNQPIIGAAGGLSRDITLGSGATLTITGANTLTVSGNWTNGGTFTPNTSTVTFNGAGQTLGGASSTTFNNLTLNTSASNNVAINSSISINAILNFSADGLLVVNSSSNITLGTAASVTNASATRYIQLDGLTGSNSNLIRTTGNNNTNWDFIFQIGTSSGGYTPVDLQTIGGVNPAASSTLAVKAIYNLSNQGQMRRTFRFTVAGNANATTFSSGVFNYKNTTDISAGDAESNYTTEWYLAASLSNSAWTNIATIGAPTNQFTVAGGSVATASLTTGIYYYTIGSIDAYPNTWYSYQSGVWSNWQNWTTDPSGSSLVNGLNLPPQPGDAISILNGITITNDVSGQVATSTTINTGGTLDMSTTTGNTLGTVSGGGTLRINGVNLPTGTYTSFVSTLGGTIEYYDNASGGASQTLPVAQTTYNKLKLTNSTSTSITFLMLNNLTVNGTFDLSTTGSGTVTWQINDGTNAQRTISLSGDLTVGTGGRIRVGTGNEASTSPHILTMYGNITNSGSIKFYDDADTELAESDYGLTYPTVGVDLHRNELQGNAVTVTFSGATDATVTCNNQTDFYRFVLNKGTGQQKILTVNSSATSNFRLFGPANIATDESLGAANSYLFVSSNALSIVNGTLQLTGSINIPVLQIDVSGTGYFPIPRNGALWLNGSNVTVQISDLSPAAFGAAKDGRILMSGLLRITAGTLFDGFSKGLGSQDGGTYLQEGGTVNCWQFRPRATGTGIFSFIQTGGTMNVGYGYALSGGKIDTYEEDYCRFDLNSVNSTFQMSGTAVLNVAKPTNTNGGLGGLFLIASSLANYNVTGGTINLYQGEETAGNSYPGYVNTTAPLYNVNIFEESATGQSIELQTNNLVVLNNLSINTGNTPAFVSNNLNVTVGGNFTINTGTTYTPGTTGTTTFNGTGAQTWTHNGTITGLASVVLNKTAGTTLTLAGASTFPSITVALTLTSGTLADGGKTITVSGTGTLTNNATHSGTGVIDYTSTTATIAGNGGTFGNLNISTNATIATAGTQTVTGALRLVGASSTLNIGSNNLIVSGNIYDAASGTTTAGFSATKRILTSGLHNAGGLTRQSIANTDILFPVGSGTLYTPNTINVLTATTFGTITVRPVNSEHPNVTTNNTSLKYYWRVTSSGFVGLGTTITHKNYNFSTTTQSGTTTTYRAARYDRSLNNWSTHNTPQTMTGNIIQPSPFNTGSGWTLGTGVVGDQLDGEYTCGNIGAFGAVTTYYSRASAAWNVNSTWSTVSVGGVAASSNPTSCPNCPVIIGDGASNNHTITMVAASSCGSLTLSSGSTLDCGTFTGHNFGTNTGGAVTGRGTLRIATTGAGTTDMFPAGDFTNFLGATGGTVEWYGATKVIPTIGPAPQNLSLATYYNLVLNPNAGATFALPATNLTIYNNLTQGGTAGFTGVIVTNGARTISVANDIAITRGTFNFTNVAASATTIIVTGNTTVANGAAFSVTGGGSANINTITTTGGITNNGTMNLNNTGVVRITFAGSSNVNFNGTGSGGTTLSTVTVNKGTSQTPTVLFSVAGTVTAATSGWLTLTNGTFDFNNVGPHTISSANATYTIPSTAKLKVSAGTVNVVTGNGTADLLLNGAIEVSGGVMNIGTFGGTNGNDIEYASAGTPTITVSSGSLNVNGSIRRSTSTITGALVYNQTGGSVTVGGNSSDNTRGVFEIDYNTGSSFTLTGTSNLTIERQTGGTGYADIFINPVAYSVSSTSTITAGLGSVATNTNFRVNIAPNVGNFTVAGGANAHTINLFSNPMILGGTLTITSPSVLVTNSLDVTIAGDLNITGTYTGGTNTTTFNGTGAQSGTLSAGSTFTNMTVNKTAGTLTLFGTAPALTNLNILNGILDVGTLALTVSGNITNNSSQVGTGSIAFASAATAHTINSSNGSFKNLSMGVVTAAPVTKLITVNGNMTITGILDFTTFGTNRYLFIGSSLLSFTSAGSISNAGATRFIKTNGVSSDLGVTRNWPVGTTSFTYSVGTRTNYTPVAINNLVVPGGGSGNYSIIPVDASHPTSSPSGPLILNYYWKILKDNALSHGATGTLVFTVPTGLIGGTGGTLIGAYLDAVSLVGWTSGGVIGVAGGNTTLTFTNSFTGASPTAVLPSSNGQFDYTYGTSTTLPSPITPVYSRFGDVSPVNLTNVSDLNTGGSWATAANWTLSSTGYGAALSSVPTGRPVVILPAARINLDILGQNAFTTTISGLLVVTTTGHNIGSIINSTSPVYNSTGTMRTSTSTLPAGTYTTFTNAGGGTIEYIAPITMSSRTTYNNLSIYSGSSGSVAMTASNLTINGNVTIPSGTTLDNSSNNANMAVTGNWSNNGTFTPGTGTVTFNGSAAQSTTGSTTFNNLTINKTNNLTLGGSTTVNGALTLTAGNIISNTYPTTPLLVLGSSSTTSGGSASSFVSGQIRKTMNSGTTFNFPIGSNSASRYRPVGVSSTSAIDTWDVSYFPTNPTGSGFPNASFNNSNMAKVSQYEYWQVANGTGTTTAGLTLSFGAGSYGGSDIGNLASLKTARWNGTQWDIPPGGGTFSQTGTNVAGTVSVSFQNAFSPQTLATDDVNSSLPVELLDFTARLNDSSVELNWSTASELNNDFFTIERAADIEQFEEVLTVKGKGTFNSKSNYSALDDSPLPGISYYRLKQTDLDGYFSYSELRKIENTDAKIHFRVYPNPIVNNKLNVELSGVEPGVTVPLKIVNLQGVSIFEASYKADQSGRLRSLVELTNVPSGLYIVIVNTETGLRKKIVIP